MAAPTEIEKREKLRRPENRQICAQYEIDRDRNGHNNREIVNKMLYWLLWVSFLSLFITV